MAFVFIDLSIITILSMELLNEYALFPLKERNKITMLRKQQLLNAAQIIPLYSKIDIRTVIK